MSLAVSWAICKEQLASSRVRAVLTGAEFMTGGQSWLTELPGVGDVVGAEYVAADCQAVGR